MKTQVHQIVRGFFMLLIAASTVMPCNDAYAQKGRNPGKSTAKPKAKAKAAAEATVGIKVKGINKEGIRVGHLTVPPPNDLAAHLDSLQRKRLSSLVSEKPVSRWELLKPSEILRKPLPSPEGTDTTEYDEYDYYVLGQKYFCKRSYELALEHFIKAAERGHVQAQFYAAWMFCEGIGTPKSREDAIKWITKAVAEGLGEAEASIVWKKINDVE